MLVKHISGPWDTNIFLFNEIQNGVYWESFDQWSMIGNEINLIEMNKIINKIWFPKWLLKLSKWRLKLYSKYFAKLPNYSCSVTKIHLLKVDSSRMHMKCLPLEWICLLMYACISVAGCENPGEIKRGYRVGSNFSSGAAVEYFCDPGFRLVSGSRLRTCENGKWSGTPPRCRGKKKDWIFDIWSRTLLSVQLLFVNELSKFQRRFLQCFCMNDLYLK